MIGEYSRLILARHETRRGGAVKNDIDHRMG